MCMRKSFIWRRTRASYGAPSSIVPVVVSFALLGSVLTSPPVVTYRTLRGSVCTIRSFRQPAMTSRMHDLRAAADQIAYLREYFDPTRAAKSMDATILDLEPWFKEGKQSEQQA